MQRITFNDLRKVTFDFVLLEKFAGVHILRENEFQGRRLSCSFCIGEDFILLSVQIISLFPHLTFQLWLWKIFSTACEKILPLAHRKTIESPG